MAIVTQDVNRGNLIAESYAEFISDLSFEKIPEEVVQQAKKCLLDSVACMLSGVGTDIGKITIDLASDLGGNAHSTIIGTEFETSRALAAFVNSTTANALDFDDTYFGHPGATVIPPALSFAESLELSGKALLCSIVAGYETSIRIGKAIAPSRRRSQKAKGLATWQIFGAVAATAKLMQLDADTTAKALGIAGAYAPVPAVIKICAHESFSATMVKNAFGLASFAGGLATELARRGFTGPVDIFDGDKGFWRISGSDRCNFDNLTRNLGEDFNILNVAFKPYPCCRYIHASLDACLGIQSQNSVRTSEIEKIEIESISRLTEWKPFDINYPPRNMVEAQFCPAYNIAVALFGIRPGPEWFDPDTLGNSEILKLASKIEVRPDHESDKILHTEHRLVAKARMKTSKGDYEREVRSARGERDNPVSKDWVENKFRNLSSKVLSKNEIAEAIETINNIENVQNVKALIEQLSGTG